VLAVELGALGQGCESAFPSASHVAERQKEDLGIVLREPRTRSASPKWPRRSRPIRARINRRRGFSRNCVP
jgi:hypothetical protein